MLESVGRGAGDGGRLWGLQQTPPVAPRAVAAEDLLQRAALMDRTAVRPGSEGSRGCTLDMLRNSYLRAAPPPQGPACVPLPPLLAPAGLCLMVATNVMS